MSNINKHPKEATPSNLLKSGIDSIILLFEKKNNEYLQNRDKNQIIISNLENKNKKLIKENYLLKKNNIRLTNIINELRNENNNLKNIINDIKGKLNIDANIASIDNSLIENNKIKIKKLNINNFGNKKRTRNITNLAREILISSSKDICLTDREKQCRKNNVLGNNINKKYYKKILLDRNLEEKNLNNSEYLVKLKNYNYYTRQRSKNNSFNQYLFNKMNNENNQTIENSAHKNNINFNSTSNIINYRKLVNYYTIDINDKKDINKLNPGVKSNRTKIINSADRYGFNKNYLNNENNKNKRRNILIKNF